MYFDTDILLKYSDPIPAGASHFLCIYRGLCQWKTTLLLTATQKMNIGTQLDQMIDGSQWEV